ncbi:MAG: tRNA 2-thiouridine(34) synthase MnmA [Sulfurovum sp.]|nr:tRNA 2-thiouridine(34) synthase MnmA [Sulfurovaceae bacterium]
MKKVLVGMSGGVDSTVTAILLQKNNYEVVGVYMKLHNEKKNYNEENYAKAQRVGAYLGISVHFIDLTIEFKKDVYNYFVESYKAGLTPNPCVKCNRSIKFGKMIEYANSLNIDFISTGHYAKCDGKNIFMAKDRSKDQSYFLTQIDKKVLPRLIFPLGEWLKDDVKDMAEEIDILADIASQKESSEICFVENDYTEILAKYMDIDIQGDTLNSEGEVVGNHKGYMHYTIGKRRGFFVNGAHDPHFVLKINPKKNQIIVGKKDELEVNNFSVKDLNLFENIQTFECQVKVRYRTNAIPASVKIENNIAKVTLKKPVFGLAIGQTASFYNGEKLLGGGIIIDD